MRASVVHTDPDSAKLLRAWVTDLGLFCLSPDAIGWCISAQFARLPLRAWVNPLRTQVNVTQAGIGRCVTCTDI